MLFLFFFFFLFLQVTQLFFLFLTFRFGLNKEHLYFTHSTTYSTPSLSNTYEPTSGSDPVREVCITETLNGYYLIIIGLQNAYVEKGKLY